MKVISCVFECPFMRNPIFGDSIPIPYKVDDNIIEFTVSDTLPINYGKVKIIYLTSQGEGVRDEETR